MKLKTFAWLLALGLLLCALPALGESAEQAGAAAATTVPFVRMDRDDPEAWKGELDNVRLVKAGLYQFGPVNEKYGIDPDFAPDETGLDSLCISGSAQFSAPQFAVLAETLRECADGRTVYIIDLRQESHALVNEGIPISWYGSHNWANAGLSLAEIEADEAARFGGMIGRTIHAYGREDDTAVNETMIAVESVMTEKELVEREGFVYLRLPVQDHTWPTPEEIDTFVGFVKSIDTSGAWLHFHCQAGKGRTGIMMMLYDMMMNPGVPMADIVIRQTMLGGSYPLYTEESDSYKVPHYRIKAAMTPLFYEYVQQQHGAGYEVPWSAWLEAQGVDDAA